MSDPLAEYGKLVEQQARGAIAQRRDRKRLAPYIAAEWRAKAGVLQAEATLSLAEAETAHESARLFDNFAAEPENPTDTA